MMTMQQLLLWPLLPPAELWGVPQWLWLQQLQQPYCGWRPLHCQGPADLQ
jgi:hypothetical protein